MIVDKVFIDCYYVGCYEISLSWSELFHHDCFFADIFDLLDHIDFFFDVSLVILEVDGHVGKSGVSLAVGSSRNVSYLSKFMPGFSLVDLWAAVVDSFDEFYFLGLFIALFVYFLDFFKSLYDFSSTHRHFFNNYNKRI